MLTKIVCYFAFQLHLLILLDISKLYKIVFLKHIGGNMFTNKKIKICYLLFRKNHEEKKKSYVCPGQDVKR